MSDKKITKAEISREMQTDFDLYYVYFVNEFPLYYKQLTRSVSDKDLRMILEVVYIQGGSARLHIANKEVKRMLNDKL